MPEGMHMKAIIFSGLLVLGYFMQAQPGFTQETVLIEARRFPQACRDPLQCIPESQLILRNLASFGTNESREVMSFLNRISSIRGITDERYDRLNSSTLTLSKR